MRMLVFFDLPVKEKSEQKAATKFRNFLIKDGYLMLQYSVYSRVCCGYDSVKTHEKRLKNHIPPNGSVRLLTITEKQYNSMEILLGEFKQSDIPASYEQLTLL
ncbi:MAG: CRISPR-associated endonuclease Cas2 [Clostridiales bacterium]|nr:CRISPR-associated endonuclease Cas2 [Clostridiales bacterium]